MEWKKIKVEGVFEIPSYYDRTSFVREFQRLISQTPFGFLGGFKDVDEKEAAATEKGKTNEF